MSLELNIQPGPAMPDRRALRDTDLDAKLRRDGAVIVDAMSEDELDDLRESVLGLYRGESAGQHYSMLSTDWAYRRSLFDEVPALIGTMTDRIFDDYDFCVPSLAFKWPGAKSIIGPHQDMSFVDESRFRSYAIWIPLVATSLENGALQILPGSHLALDNLRVMPGDPPWFKDDLEGIETSDFVALETEPGQVVVWDHAVLHASGGNFTDQLRPALLAAFKPVEAELLHYHMVDRGSAEVDVYDGSGEFFKELIIGTQPTVEPIARRQFYGTKRSNDEILELSRRWAGSDLELFRRPVGQASDRASLT